MNEFPAQNVDFQWKGENRLNPFEEWYVSVIWILSSEQFSWIPEHNWYIFQ